MINAQSFIETLNGKPVALFGLGGSGMATLEWLLKSGIEVYAWDDRAHAHRAAKDFGANVQMLDVEILKSCACLVLAPGVPLTHPEPHDVVKTANQAGCEIIGDIEILERCNHGYKTIAITGTNGKSTTTALLTHVLNACGKTALMGGNIGVPVLNLDPQKDDTIFVLEVSSYQIDLSPTFAPDIGILLNITTDHIDRHGSFENYAAIKNRLLDASALAIRAEKLYQAPLKGHIFPMLPGAHNAQNIIAVLEVCKAINIDQSDAIKAIKTFPGLAHRQYLALTIGHAHYINDSKGTNVEATAKALGCHENIFWIVGGQAKTGGLSGLEKYKDRITHAYLIGESAMNFEVWMKDQGIDYTLCETLEKAIPAAHIAAQSQTDEAVVLLSPACASWDQFKSFEHRGDTFIEIVEEL